MTELQQIEYRLLELTSTFDLRPTLEKAADIGDLLLAAREMVPHGQWNNWLARLRLNRRTAWDYIAVAKAKDGNRWPATRMTIKGFLSFVRRANYARKDAERQEERRKARRALGTVPDGINLSNVDCRQYSWPTPVDLVVADPPWLDLTHYEWLGPWAAEHLREGGLALIQASQPFLPQIMRMLGTKLTYVWTMSMVYSEARTIIANGRFKVSWRPVLVYAKGTAKIPESVSDTYEVRNVGDQKIYHAWEQPAAPFQYWLSGLLPPGQLVADPFAGSGTIPLVCHELGLRYVGTEIDEKAFKVARGRLRKAYRPAG